MKKLCFLVDSIFSFGGVQRVTAVIAKELAKEFHVTIVTFDEPSTMETSLYQLSEANIQYKFLKYPPVSRLKNKCCKIYSYLYRRILPQTKLTSDLYAMSSFPSEKRNALIEILQEGQYDTIIGVHAPLSVRLASCKSKLPHSKLIGWIHNSHEALFSSNSPYYIGPELVKYYEYQLGKLYATVVLSHDDARKYNIPVRVIYNPLTVEPGSPSAGNSKKFLAIGRFSPRHKGFDLLIEAFHIFAQSNREWTLDIVGEGTEEPMYRKLIKNYDLENRIRIHPFTNHIQSYYSHAQIYILSSRWEGFGLVLVEAMAHGLPVISSDLPTSKEIMGDFGIYFENGNINQLAKQMVETTKMEWLPKSREAFSIAKHFEVEHIREQWKAIINN